MEAPISRDNYQFHIDEFEKDTGFLVGLHIRGSRPLLSVEESLSELKMLAETAGIEVIGQTHQNVNNINPSTFIGSGKAQEIKEEIEAEKIKIVIFDDELNPRHQRELEKIFGDDIQVLDRSALILDIFAQHASTREGTLQVELAQYEYRLPRLTRAWTHLARQAGGGSARGGAGVGLRGPGETQLESDRREIGRIITKLKSEIENVRAHRSRLREQRDKTGMPVVALVGYTNAGKSTLMNAITDAEVYVANQLFATLDTTTRKVDLPSGQNVLLSDTVGFIQKLPTTLIEAFKATLEGIVEADLLLHVVDITSPHYEQHIETVDDTLAEIEVPRIPRILVLNKIDQLEEKPDASQFLSKEYNAVVTVSALGKLGIEQLLKEIENQFKTLRSRVQVLIPYNKGDIASWVYENGIVEEEEHGNEGVTLTVQLSTRSVGFVSDYIINRMAPEN